MGVIVQSLFLIYDSGDKNYDERDHIYNIYYKDPLSYGYIPGKGYTIVSAITLVVNQLIPAFINGDVIIIVDVKLPISFSVQIILDTYKKRGLNATISQTTFLVNNNTRLYLICKDYYDKTLLYSQDSVYI